MGRNIFTLRKSSKIEIWKSKREPQVALKDSLTFKYLRFIWDFLLKHIFLDISFTTIESLSLGWADNFHFCKYFKYFS